MTQLLNHRFFTFNSVIRVNQIESTRTLTRGVDEAADHTPESVEMLREALRAGCPDARMTWAVSWRALWDDRPNYRQIRELLVRYHREYGDDVTAIVGAFFPNVYSTREQVNDDWHEALARVSEIVGGGYRPGSVIAGFLAAENHRYLAEVENVHVCQGNIWSQYAIDEQGGDGSLCYPYYPSREHFCKPAQGPADFIDCVSLDGWTCDFLAARRPGFAEGFNSRLGVGPIETLGHYDSETALRQILATTAVHFDQGFALNGFAWVTVAWEAVLVPQVGHLDALTTWLKEMCSRWPGTKVVPLAEFGEAWRSECRDNGPINYRFIQRGTGIGGSDANLEIRWFMNREFRLALLRDWQINGPTQVIDFTRYDLPAREPQDLGEGDWSLLGQINQKRLRPQDNPIPLRDLPASDVERILSRYPELDS